MDIKALRPNIFAADHESSDGKRQWLHWHKSFTTYIDKIDGINDSEKLDLLINHTDSSVYELISESETCNEAVDLLNSIYAKTPIFARFVLKSCKQQAGESLDTYLQNLKRLSSDCNFRAVSVTVHQEEAITDAFISGLMSNEIRQQLLENPDLTLSAAYEKCRLLQCRLSTTNSARIYF